MLEDRMDFQNPFGPPRAFPSCHKSTINLKTRVRQIVTRKSLSPSGTTNTLGKDDIVAKKKKVSGDFDLIDDENIEGNSFDHPADDAPASDSASNSDDNDTEEESDSEDSVDDPVRMYLMQMGRIPLLNRDEEVASAIEIEKTKDLYRNSMLATDYMLNGAVDSLEKVRDGQLRLDRTIEVSVTNTSEKKRIMKKLVPNVESLRDMLAENRKDFKTAISKSSRFGSPRASTSGVISSPGVTIAVTKLISKYTDHFDPRRAILVGPQGALSSRQRALRSPSKKRSTC